MVYCASIQFPTTSSTYIASASLIFGNAEHVKLSHVVDTFNSLAYPPARIHLDLTQEADSTLSKYGVLFSLLHEAHPPRDKACLRPMCCPSFLVPPVARLVLHIDPNELQTATKWWLWLGVARGGYVWQFYVLFVL